MSEPTNEKKIDPELNVQDSASACETCGATDWGVANFTDRKTFNKCDKCHEWNGFELVRKAEMELQ